MRKSDQLDRNGAPVKVATPRDVDGGVADSTEQGGGVALDHHVRWVAGVRERLVCWYVEAGRDLPCGESGPIPNSGFRADAGTDHGGSGDPLF